MSDEMTTSTGTAGDGGAAGQRTACLVLTIGPDADMAWIAEAVGHAEEAVLADPVFEEMARVATITGVDVDGNPDAIAGVVDRELRGWAQSPARNPGNRVAFGLLVVHPDREAADTVARGLAAADTMARLPVVVLAGAPEQPSSPAEEPEPGPAPGNPHTEVVRMVLDAVTSTARAVERAPGFAVDVASLSGPRTSPSGPPAAAPAARRRWPRPALRSTPIVELDVIDELSQVADRVTMLYLVLVPGPWRFARRGRGRRLAVTVELARAVLAPRSATSADRWYARAFLADECLRPGRPLPVATLIRGVDLPQYTGRSVDISRCVDDVRHTARLDRASFVRRGMSRPGTVVVFVADGPPTGSDWRPQLSRLCAEGRVAWVNLRPDVTLGTGVPSNPDDQQGVGPTFMHDHEDLASELLSFVTKDDHAGR